MAREEGVAVASRRFKKTSLMNTPVRLAMKKLILHTDGGARGNPGPAGIGAALTTPEGDVVAEVSRYIGETTNNQAEYRALIAGLEKAKEVHADSLTCYLDSELIVKQLQGDYKIKNADLKPLVEIVRHLAHQFKEITFTHVPRERNKHADSLVNRAIDAAGR